MQKEFNRSVDLGDGRTISIETGKLAKQADGAVVLKCGDTMLLATIVSNKEADKNVDFLPMMIDYKEKYASTGRMPGGFLKREGRPSDHEILICRLVDRALRPLFPEDYHASTLVQIMLLSSDGETMPDSLACFAASAALHVSDIPFESPISEVRIGRIEGQWKINPAKTELETADVDIMVAATMDSVVMVEGEMSEVSEEEMLEAIKLAHEAIKVQCQLQLDLANDVGREVRTYDHEDADEALQKQIHDFCYQKFADIAAKGIANKEERSSLFDEVKEAYKETLSEEELEEKAFLIAKYMKATQKEAVREIMLSNRTRLDGRKLDEIRPIWSEVNYLPASHGSSVFTRGETQSLTTVTLGAKMDEQLIDGAFISGTQSFLLHYNFPSFSTGEARIPRGTSRREVGHGNLALRALRRMLPDTCPYTVRVVSDILESNGSSSMATVCAGSLALMDAGIQVKAGVSGIAMGLISDDSGNYAVLSDILGDEDHLGDMDFKVAGTEAGITAVQMDIKIKGLSYEILQKALEQAKAGRAHILGEMNKTLSAPRETYKPHAPTIEVIKIDSEFIGAVIGPGGKVIQEIQAESGATIHISEEDDKGIVEIFGPNRESVDKALQTVKLIVTKPEVGEVYDSVVKKVADYGVFVEFLPKQQGLLHISEISWSRLESISDSGLNEGDSVKVKLVGIDPKGRFKLSRKVLIERPATT